MAQENTKMAKSKKKELIIALIALGVVALMTALYFVVSAVIKNSEEEESRPMYDEDGDLYGTADRVFMYPNITRADVQEITVKNEHGGYKVYRETDNNFYFVDAELANYSAELFASLVVNCTYTLSDSKIRDVTDYSVYGLNEEQLKATVEVKTTKGEIHKIMIGSKTPTGSGYYCKYGNKPFVYILDSELEKSVLAPLTSFLTPIVSVQIGSTDYVNIDNFYFSKRENPDDEKISPFIHIRKKTDEEKEKSDTTNPYIFGRPDQYIVSVDAFSSVQQTLAQLQGTAVVDYGIIPAQEEEDPEGYAKYREQLKKWGLDKPMYELLYEYDGEYYSISFSAENEDGNYYAYSILAGTVVEIPADNIQFLKWDLLKFVSNQVFSMNIDNVSKIVTEFDGKAYEFLLVKGDDGKLAEVFVDGKSYDVKAFRQYYITILELTIMGKSEPPAEGTEPTMKLSIYNKLDDVFLEFFNVSTRKVFYTSGGKGEFYVNVDKIKQLKEETIAIFNGEIIK